MAKSKFRKHTASDVVRLTNIASVQDQEIWRLVTPIARKLLGPIQSCQEQLVETVQGLFPGDEVSNLNDHRLYGGKSGYLRFPYLHTFYKTANGAIVIKRDGVKFKLLCWFGNVEKGAGQLILKLSLRDRCFDGTPAANDTALLDYPFDHPIHNARLPFDAKSVEYSIYGFIPNTRIATTGDNLYDSFVENPFQFVDNPKLFLQFFRRAWNSERAPGQNATPLPDLSKIVLPELESIARRHGYDFMECAPSHYHVVLWVASAGYHFTDPENEKLIAKFTEQIKSTKAQGKRMTRAQESWLCVVQSLPQKLIPPELYLGGIKWPQSNLDVPMWHKNAAAPSNQKNLWMNKDIYKRR